MTFDAKSYIKDLPQAPGIYQMLDINGEIIYVGKARSLKSRVASYFNGKAKDNKTMKLVQSIANMRHHLTRSESEALILENQLIKKHTPKYNVLLKDGKSYPYIYASIGEDSFPRIEFRRGSKKAKGRYFGPYPSAQSVRQTLHFLQKTFKVRQCNNSTFENRSRPCLQHQINRCTAPCVGLVSKEDYKKQLKYSFDFIQGHSNQVVKELISRMEQAAEAQRYEQAGEFRDQIQAIRLIQSKQFVENDLQLNVDVMVAAQQAGVYMVTVATVRNGQLLGYRNHIPSTPKETPLNSFLAAFISLYVENKNMASQLICNLEPENQSELQQTLSELLDQKVSIITRPRGAKRQLLQLAEENCRNALAIKANKFATWQNKWQTWVNEVGLSQAPKRVECFDISHQMGEHTRASCVVFNDEGADKKAYRQYIIENITGGDDYAAMRQVIEKRLASIDKHQLGFPDIFLIDGGKGQVNQALTILAEQNITAISVLGVTKDDNRTAGEERLYLPESSQFIKPEKHGLLSLMIQYIRDEAHRFAITNHRKAFKKSRQTSALENIPGIGQKRRDTILKHFGGMQGLKKSSLEDITKINGISENVALKIYEFLHPAKQ
ncbi:excinuclease ABC subunit UvrC [Marinicella rhabdoformis]|uniref:excinuclease ABC subunit UvrC n=1 Tax=Marinicella rhabdoformis TaxID=2580566 RepID=UPI0012AEBEE7|nr:excinuclease ABC subunit UvrC [Marinicella rhabdoformis]